MADKSKKTSHDCAYIDNTLATGENFRRESAGWDSPGCCLRLVVFRFPPYIDFAGKPLFPDFDAEELHMCGAMIESLKILAAAVNCPCLQRVPNIILVLNGSADVRVVADYSYTQPEMLKFQTDHYPLGSMSLGSILGRENPTEPPGIDLATLYTPVTWTSFISSIIAVALVLNLVTAAMGKLQQKPAGFLHKLPNSFINTLGIQLGQSMGWYINFQINDDRLFFKSYKNKSTISKLFLLRAAIVCGWSLIAKLILSNVTISNLLEALLYTPGTDRFKSLMDLIIRITSDKKLSADYLVTSFDRSPLYYMLESGVVSLPCEVDMIAGTADVASKMIGLLDKLQENLAVMVGVAATLTYIKSAAIHMLGCAECEDFVYIQEDESYTVPYYMKTTTFWPADKLKRWRRTTAVLLESGLSDFVYRRALTNSIPEQARQEARDREEHDKLLNASQLVFHELYTIVELCFVLSGFACIIFMGELSLKVSYNWLKNIII